MRISISSPLLFPFPRRVTSFVPTSSFLHNARRTHCSVTAIQSSKRRVFFFFKPPPYSTSFQYPVLVSSTPGLPHVLSGPSYPLPTYLRVSLASHPLLRFADVVGHPALISESAGLGSVFGLDRSSSLSLFVDAVIFTYSMPSEVSLPLPVDIDCS